MPGEPRRSQVKLWELILQDLGYKKYRRSAMQAEMLAVMSLHLGLSDCFQMLTAMMQPTSVE